MKADKLITWEHATVRITNDHVCAWLWQAAPSSVNQLLNQGFHAFCTNPIYVERR
jgi:hypothetical protein